VKCGAKEARGQPLAFFVSYLMAIGGQGVRLAQPAERPTEGPHKLEVTRPKKSASHLAAEPRSSCP
jgi:hypothetical protein